MKRYEYKYNNTLKLIAIDNEEFDSITCSYDRKLSLYTPDKKMILTIENHQLRDKKGINVISGTNTSKVRCFDTYFAIEQKNLSYNAPSKESYVSAVYDYSGKILAVYQCPWKDDLYPNNSDELAMI